jgi:serine/threonine protein kinase
MGGLMSAVSCVNSLKDRISIFGIDGGQSVGKMLIRWRGKSVELLNLTVESKSTKSPSERAAEKSSEARWVVLRTEGQGLYLEADCFNRQLREKIPNETDAKAILTFLCSSTFLPICSAVEGIGSFSGGVPTAFQKQDLSLLQAVMLEDMKPLAPDESSQESFKEKVSHIVSWVNQLPVTVGTISWGSDNWAKLEHLPFPVRCYRHPQTGNVDVYITLGVITVGSQKVIKSEIFMREGKICRLVRLAPRKTSPEGGRFPQGKIEANRKQIFDEAVLVQRFKGQGVPNLASIRCVGIQKEAKTKYRFLMNRYTEDLEEYNKRLEIEGAWDSTDMFPWNLREVLSLHLQVLDALRGLHARGLVHKDLRAANVLQRKGEGGEEARLIDFSFASTVDKPEVFSGTCGCMAPELFGDLAGKSVSPATDMWSFGVMLNDSTQHNDCPFAEVQEALADRITTCSRRLGEMMTGQEVVAAFLAAEHKDQAVEESRDQWLQEQSALLALENEATQPLRQSLEQQIEAFREQLNDGKDELKLLIRDLLSVDPAQRPTAQQANVRLQAIHQRVDREAREWMEQFSS